MIAIRNFGAISPLDLPLAEKGTWLDPDYEWERTAWGVGGPGMTAAKYCQMALGVKKWKLTKNSFFGDSGGGWTEVLMEADLMDQSLNEREEFGDYSRTIAEVLHSGSGNIIASEYYANPRRTVEGNYFGDAYVETDIRWPGLRQRPQHLSGGFRDNWCKDADGNLYAPFVFRWQALYDLFEELSNHGDGEQRAAAPSIDDEGFVSITQQFDGEMHFLGETFRVPVVHTAEYWEAEDQTPYPFSSLWLKIEPVEWWDYGGKINTTTGAPV